MKSQLQLSALSVLCLAALARRIAALVVALELLQHLLPATLDGGESRGQLCVIHISKVSSSKVNFGALERAWLDSEPTRV